MPTQAPSCTENEVMEKLDRGIWDFMERPGNEFFSTLLSHIKLMVDPHHKWKTAWTDGLRMGFHPEFTMRCNHEELQGVFFHELQHIIYEHVAVAIDMDLDKEIHNIATDHYNNLEAKDLGYVLPHWIKPYCDPKFKGWSSMDIYDYLMDDANKEEREDQRDQLGGSMGADIESIEDEGEGGLSAEEIRARVQDNVIQAVIQCDINGTPGSVPSDVRRMYEELTAPKVDWWKIITRKMTKYARDDWSLRRPNRRHLHQGLYMPSLYNEVFGSIAFGFDVSDSMSQDELSLCVAVSKNIRAMLKPETTYIMSFDVEVHECDELKAHHPFTKLELIGGGGTDVNPFLELCIEKKPDVMIIFTDGGFFKPRAMDDINEKDIYWVLTESPWCTQIKGTQIRMDQI